MSDIMMQLGAYQFGLDTAAYQDFQRSTAYVWAAQPRFGQDDALQSTGNGEDTINLTGLVFPEFRGGTGQLESMRALAAQKVPQTLVDGLGRVMGEWVIQTITEGGTIYAQRGVARRQEFSMTLRRYPADGVNLGSLFGGLVASLAGTSSAANAAASVAASAAKGPAGILSSMNSALGTVTGMASSIGAQASTIIGAVRSGITAAKRLQNGGEDAARSLQTIGTLSNIPSAMRSLVELGGGVAQAAGVSSAILKRAGVDLTAASADPAAITAVEDALVATNRLTVMAVGVRTSAQSIIDRA